ncbi:unnamed protein product [Lactuca virosa]|uniref:Uncharacterized protein n=1 Tax=Lactuca virosa TaxID=75947 RepID=A0AAU9PQ03_9ASTR|nr:unnamed protein product [Lactuca virosa]
MLLSQLILHLARIGLYKTFFAKIIKSIVQEIDLGTDSIPLPYHPRFKFGADHYLVNCNNRVVIKGAKLMEEKMLLKQETSNGKRSGTVEESWISRWIQQQ